MKITNTTVPMYLLDERRLNEQTVIKNYKNSTSFIEEILEIYRRITRNLWWITRNLQVSMKKYYKLQEIYKF